MSGDEQGVHYNPSLDERMVKTHIHSMVTTSLSANINFYSLCQLWTSHSFIPIREWCRVVRWTLEEMKSLLSCGNVGKSFHLPKASHLNYNPFSGLL